MNFGMPVVYRFAPVEPPTLKQRISMQIQRAILQGHLPPGTRIVETTLAADMGVAQSSIREAMRTRGYVYCGVVSVRPGMKLKAVAYRSGMADSVASEAAY